MANPVLMVLESFTFGPFARGVALLPPVPGAISDGPDTDPR